MKQKTIAVVFAFLPFIIMAQKQINVAEGSYTMSTGVHNGFKTEIPQTAIKDVIRDWKKHLGVNGKGKISETNGEVSMKGAINNLISAKPFNIYSIASSSPAGVVLTVWFTPNDTVFLSKQKNSTEATAAQRFVRDFAAAEYYLAVRDELKHEREKLEKQKDELEKAIRDEERTAIKVAENKRAIARAEEDLATNDADIKSIIAEISLQQAEVNKTRAANADAFKEADAGLKTLEDSKKKLEDRKEALHKKIDEWNKNLASSDRGVTNAKQNQKQILADIEKQKVLVRDIEAKLKGIK
jgi:hypothetical protein